MQDSVKLDTLTLPSALPRFQGVRCVDSESSALLGKSNHIKENRIGAVLHAMPSSYVVLRLKYGLGWNYGLQLESWPCRRNGHKYLMTPTGIGECSVLIGANQHRIEAVKWMYVHSANGSESMGTGRVRSVMST